MVAEDAAATEGLEIGSRSKLHSYGSCQAASSSTATPTTNKTRHSYHNMPYMKGHAVGASLRLPDGPKLELIGAYLPSSGGIDIGEEDKATSVSGYIRLFANR